MTGAETIAEAVDAGVAAVVASVQWQPLSDPLDHGTACCAAARSWLSAVHAAEGPTTPLNGLGWIAAMYPWGPSRWPMWWCNLVEQEELDCGAQAAVAREVLRGSAAEVVGVQLLIHAGGTDIGHWRCTWRDEEVSEAWLFDRLYYHEAVGVVEEGLVVFDPTRNWRVPPEVGVEPGSVAAIRVHRSEPGLLRWGPHELVPGQWAMLGTGGDDRTS